jgi:4-alpha-glucanotransferase
VPNTSRGFSGNCVAYTGTHDNNTVRGWFEKEATPDDRKRLFSYLGRQVPKEELPPDAQGIDLKPEATCDRLPVFDLGVTVVLIVLQEQFAVFRQQLSYSK